MAGPKADRLTAEQRTEAVYRLILDGWTPDQICQNVSKSFRVSDRQVHRYIDAAWERIQATAAPEREEHLNRAVAAGYQMLREAKTVKEKMAVWSFMARLLGLYAPDRHELGGPNGGAVVIQMTWGDYDNGNGDDATG